LYLFLYIIIQTILFILILTFFFILINKRNNEDIFQPPVPPEPQPQPEIDLEPLNVTQFGNYARGDPDTEGFNPVSVAPAQGSFVQNVFDDNEISEEDLQNMALQSLPGESEVHYINTEIPHQQNDYIPSATLTKYRVGHYQFTENGTRLMSYADHNVDPETPSVWVIPGVIDINVPPPQMDPEQNIIVANGIFNLVDNDDDPNDIEIEPDEPNPNINTRSTNLIKSTKTIKTIKLEKQEEKDEDNENKTRDAPERISLGQIRVNVPTTVINNEYDYGNNYWKFGLGGQPFNSNWTQLTFDYSENPIPWDSLITTINIEEPYDPESYIQNKYVCNLVVYREKYNQTTNTTEKKIFCCYYFYNAQWQLKLMNGYEPSGNDNSIYKIFYVTLGEDVNKNNFTLTNEYDLNKQQSINLIGTKKLMDQMYLEDGIRLSEDFGIDGINNNVSSFNIIFDWQETPVPTPNITQISNYPITQNGSQNIPIPNNAFAVDSINVNVQVPTSGGSSSLQDYKSLTINNSGVFNVLPDNGYDAIREVIVDNNAVELEKTFYLLKENASQTTEQTMGDNPYTGKLQLEHSINPESGKYAMKSVSVLTETQNKEIIIEENGQTIIEADENQGYVGLNKVSVIVSVPQSGGGGTNLGNNNWRSNVDPSNSAVWKSLISFPEDENELIINVNEPDSLYYPYHVIIFIVIKDDYQTQGGSYSNQYVGCYLYACKKSMKITIDNYWRHDQKMDIYYSFIENPNTFEVYLNNQYDYNSIQQFILPYIDSRFINTSDNDDGSIPEDITIDINKKRFLNCNQSINLIGF